MIVPISAPPIMPDIETVRARYPSRAATRFTTMAHGRCAATACHDAAAASAVTVLASHSTADALNGTEMLSSRRTGIASTSAPAAAATIGATSENSNGGTGVTEGRVQHASATPASEPNTKKPAVPAIVFSAFHGSFAAPASAI